nr:DNA ligase 1-like [Procambarus clarkii]
MRPAISILLVLWVSLEVVCVVLRQAEERLAHTWANAFWNLLGYQSPCHVRSLWTWIPLAGTLPHLYDLSRSAWLLSTSAPHQTAGTSWSNIIKAALVVFACLLLSQALEDKDIVDLESPVVSSTSGSSAPRQVKDGSRPVPQGQQHYSLLQHRWCKGAPPPPPDTSTHSVPVTPQMEDFKERDEQLKKEIDKYQEEIDKARKEIYKARKDREKQLKKEIEKEQKEIDKARKEREKRMKKLKKDKKQEKRRMQKEINIKLREKEAKRKAQQDRRRQLVNRAGYFLLGIALVILILWCAAILVVMCPLLMVACVMLY